MSSSASNVTTSKRAKKRARKKKVKDEYKDLRDFGRVFKERADEFLAKRGVKKGSR